MKQKSNFEGVKRGEFRVTQEEDEAEDLSDTGCDQNQGNTRSLFVSALARPVFTMNSSLTPSPWLHTSCLDSNTTASVGAQIANFVIRGEARRVTCNVALGQTNRQETWQNVIGDQ